jgi:RNA polymerase primary sigma factor
MPRVARFTLDALADLHRQLAYAPEEARQRIVAAAEDLADDIEFGQDYPMEFVVYRLTGYRPDLEGEPVTFTGAEILTDLATLVQHLSVRLDLPPRREGGAALRVGEVARRLRVTPRTVQRYRRNGLIFHYVRFDDEERRLACYEDALERFRARHLERVRRAGAFSRVGADREAEIIEAARRLVAREPISLNAAARRIAARFGRAHETVRRVLRAHDDRAAEPVFPSAPGPLTSRQSRRLERGWRYGLPIAHLARHHGKAPATVLRAVNRCRVDRLRRLDLSYVDFPTFELPDAESVILASPVVAGGLDRLPPHDTADVLLAATRGGEPPSEADIDALVAGYNVLKRRVVRGLAEEAPWPSVRDVDRAETDLRWAARLQARLLGMAMPALILTIERSLHRPLAERPGEEIVRLIELAARVGVETIGSLDPSRGHRLEGRCAYELDRRLAAVDSERSARAAAVRHDPGAAPPIAPFDGVAAWSWLELPGRWRGRLGRLELETADLVRRHFGVGPDPPRTCAELAVSTGGTPSGVARKISGAITELRRIGARVTDDG